MKPKEAPSPLLDDGTLHSKDSLKHLGAQIFYLLFFIRLTSTEKELKLVDGTVFILNLKQALFDTLLQRIWAKLPQLESCSHYQTRWKRCDDR